MAPSELTLRSRAFEVGIDGNNGSVRKLAHPPDQHGVNFVLNAHQAPDMDVEDTRWVGDLLLHVRHGDEGKGQAMTTGLSKERSVKLESEDCVSVSYSGESQANGGLWGLQVTEKYSLSGDSKDILTWSIEINNPSKADLEVEDLGIPLPMSSYWGNDQIHNYEQSVHRHSFVGGSGSYVYWQKPSGHGPILVMSCGPGTSLEYKDRTREDEEPFGQELPKWEGLVAFYLHSKNAVRLNRSRQYLPATSLRLAPGQSRKYEFSFRWAENYQDLHDAIYASGGLDVVALPGMVVPSDTTCTLAVRSVRGISSVTYGANHEQHAQSIGTSNGYEVFTLTLPQLGENFVKVTATNSEQTTLQYFSIEPIAEVIEKHSSFLAKNQLARSSRSYNGAFLQWDMTTQKLITWDDYPEGGWKEWMAGGSDDLGLAPAAYLSEKCLVYPVQAEISAVDFHIENFLLGYMLGARDEAGQRTWQVYRWFDGQDGSPKDTGIWRAYNYTHIANTLFNMYRIAKAYPRFEVRHPGREYLSMAYEVLNAMYAKIPVPNPIGDAANTLGLMGESTVPEIVAALQEEEMQKQSQILQQHTERKVRYYEGINYPFASEMTIDTTGFESVYALSKERSLRDLIEKSQRASLASRGLQPLWYYYGSDNRMQGESWWNLGYETQLGAWQQQDYLLNYSHESRADFADSMRSTYGAYLAGWANINSGQIDGRPDNIGAASWLWQSEGGKPAFTNIPLIGCWWSWSGEAELGFWGALRTACVNVVTDPIVGLYAYGGRLESRDGKYAITPQDGVQQRLAFFCLDNLAIHVQKARYSKAVVAHDASEIEVTLESASLSGNGEIVVSVRNAPAGSYQILAGDVTLHERLSVSRNAALSLRLPESARSFTMRRQ